jgi:hypothetical protein
MSYPSTGRTYPPVKGAKRIKKDNRNQAQASEYPFGRVRRQPRKERTTDERM